MRTLVGAVGYRNLSDHSAAGEILDRLIARPWPPDVAVEDVSYNPIALAQRLEDEPEGRRFERLVLIGCTSRAGRQPGTVTTYRWDGVLPAAETVQAAVTEAVTGVISLDNTLMLLRQFGPMPREVIVVEIQPATEGFGDAFSAAVARAVDRVEAMVYDIAVGDALGPRVPELSLGGGSPRA